MILQRIPKENIEGAWPLVRALIVDAAGRSNGRYTEQTVIQGLMEARYQLWVVWDETEESVLAVVVTQILEYPTGLRVGEVIFVTGQNRKQWVHLISDLEQWARDEDCGIFQLMARRGWARDVTNYKMSHVLLEKKL